MTKLFAEDRPNPHWVCISDRKISSAIWQVDWLQISRLVISCASNFDGYIDGYIEPLISSRVFHYHESPVGNNVVFCCVTLKSFVLQKFSQMLSDFVQSFRPAAQMVTVCGMLSHFIVLSSEFMVISD